MLLNQIENCSRQAPHHVAYRKKEAQAALDSYGADALAIGVPFSANPDLVTRLKQDLPLGESPVSTWYMGVSKAISILPGWQL